MRRRRACPLCGSKAVSATERRETEEGDVRLEVCCGECWTWRAAIGRRAADAFERRLRRDRDRMAISTGQAERWRELELGRLAQWPPQGSRRKTHG